MNIPSAKLTCLSRFVKILSDFQRDLVTRVLPMTHGRQLTLSQYLLLGVLRDVRKPISVAVIASFMETTRPHAKLLLDRLIAMGCVNRNRNSRRYYATMAGLKQLDEINRQRSVHIEGLLLRLTDEELALGISIYEKMLRQRMEEKLTAEAHEENDSMVA